MHPPASEISSERASELVTESRRRPPHRRRSPSAAAPPRRLRRSAPVDRTRAALRCAAHTSRGCAPSRPTAGVVVFFQHERARVLRSRAWRAREPVSLASPSRPPAIT
ncbi:hypothetical protein RJ55_04564 [Drechmeria coniospora]|nr:hypothetical protein RJ55_04564 [Drechmeria coniospora]